MKNVKIVSIESEFGAGTKGAKLGPAAVLKELSLNYPHEVVPAAELDDDEPSELVHHGELIIDTLSRAVTLLSGILEEKAVPLIFTGDHSNGLAAISAYKEVFPKNRLGVIWIDAHADLHSPYSTHSGNIHGMPLAAALGRGSEANDRNKPDRRTESIWNDLVKLGKKRLSPKLQPADLVLIDIRDAEEEELEWMNQKGIRFFTPADRKSLGIPAIIQTTLEHLSQCDHLLVSFDVDSLDPELSYGTGTPVPDGLNHAEAVALLSGFLSQPKVFAMEVTEINPLLDRHQPMEKTAASILREVFQQTGFPG